jgi:hypothetical protein
MPHKRGPLPFKLTDVARAKKAAIAAGDPNARIVIDVPRQTITIIPGGEPAKDGDINLDRELAEFEARHGEAGR